MITHVNHVLIGKKANTAAANADALAVGDIAVFDQNMKITDGTYADKLYIGVCTGKVSYTDPQGAVKSASVMKYSAPIQLEAGAEYKSGNYVAPTQEKVEIDLSASEVTIGHRYVLRILYKDIEAANFQFTHTYETIATSVSVEDMANALIAKINKHPNRRVNAVYSENKIVLTAMEKTDNEGVESLNEYSVVSMEVSLYVTIPGALLSNQPEKVAGAVITKTAANPGKGYWKQVRDAELRAMGYSGHVLSGAYPSVEQERMVTKDATYNYVTIEWDNLYVSPDNQYIKTTPLTAEIYCEGDVAAITAILDTFLG